MISIYKVLSDRDPDFIELPEEQQIQVVNKLSSNPQLLYKVLNDRDPEFTFLPEETKAQVINTLMQSSVSASTSADKESFIKNADKYIMENNNYGTPITPEEMAQAQGIYNNEKLLNAYKQTHELTPEQLKTLSEREYERVKTEDSKSLEQPFFDPTFAAPGGFVSGISKNLPNALLKAGLSVGEDFVSMAPTEAILDKVDKSKDVSDLTKIVLNLAVPIAFGNISPKVFNKLGKAVKNSADKIVFNELKSIFKNKNKIKDTETLINKISKIHDENISDEFKNELVDMYGNLINKKSLEDAEVKPIFDEYGNPIEIKDEKTLISKIAKLFNNTTNSKHTNDELKNELLDMYGNPVNKPEQEGTVAKLLDEHGNLLNNTSSPEGKIGKVFLNLTKKPLELYTEDGNIIYLNTGADPKQVEKAFNLVIKPIAKLNDALGNLLQSKVYGTKFDKTLRKIGLTEHGLGGVSRETEDFYVNTLYGTQRPMIAEGTKKAQEAANKIKSHTVGLDDGEIKKLNQVIIKYLENPKARNSIKKEFPDLAKNLDEVVKTIDETAEDLFQRGYLLPSQRQKWAESYLKRLYVKDDEIQGTTLGSKRGKQYEIKHGRKIESIMDLSPEERAKLGYLEDPETAIKLTVLHNTHTSALDEFYRQLIKNEELIPYRDLLVKLPEKVGNLPEVMSPFFASKKVIPYLNELVKAGKFDKEVYDSFKKEVGKKLRILKSFKANKKSIPKDIIFLGDETKTRYGVLSGLPVHRDLALQIKDFANVNTSPEDFADKLDKTLGSMFLIFKINKVPLNIFAYPRNFITNISLWAMSKANPARFFDYYAKAVTSFVKKDKWYNLAEKNGLFHTNFASEEISKIADEISKMDLKNNPTRKVLKYMAEFTKKASEPYGWIDDMAKLARMRYAIEKQGMSVKKAIRVAQDTHFDYSLVPSYVRKIRSPNIKEGIAGKLLGNPFLTFTQKMVARTYNQFLENPVYTSMVLATPLLIRYAMEKQMVKKYGKAKVEFYKKMSPTYLANPTLTMYIHKDGTVNYIDPSYIFPQGNLINAIYDSARGDIKEFFKELGFGTSPLTIASNIMSNRDPFTERPIYNDLDSRALQIAEYIVKQIFTPATIQKTLDLSKTTHPILPRLAGVPVYRYDLNTLLNIKKSQINNLKTQLLREIGREKMLYTAGKITPEDYKKRVEQLLKEFYIKANELVNSGY